MVACSYLILYANLGSSTLCRSGDNELQTQRPWFLSSKAKNSQVAEAAQAVNLASRYEKVNSPGLSWVGIKFLCPRCPTAG